MLFRLALGAVTSTALIALTTGTAAAQGAALDDDTSGDAVPEASTLEAPKTNVGVGIRLRNVRIPKGMLEWFVEEVPGGVSNFGIGAELSRRKGEFEVQFGLEYEKLTVTPGIWIEKDKPLPGATADDVRDDGFGWVTAELSFMYHTPIVPQLAVRYGGGAGLGILMGSVRRTDQICGTSSTDSCVDDPTGENQDSPYDTPPVMLVVNAIIGLQVRPTNEIFINIETGVRTVPFFGMTAGYYF
ncbi:MAG TPA: hypothetical protein VM261_11190 [Kofleriaceae bacterium]|nr:hypothetical protein [Kofleriaceae bacterium]